MSTWKNTHTLKTLEGADTNRTSVVSLDSWVLNDTEMRITECSPKKLRKLKQDVRKIAYHRRKACSYHIYAACGQNGWLD